MNKFEKRASGAQIYCGESVVKLGPDSEREAELLNHVFRLNMSPEVMASGPDFMVMEKLQPVPHTVFWKAKTHLMTLRDLHTVVKTPQHLEYRNCSVETYYQHVRGNGRHLCVPEWMYWSLDRYVDAARAREGMGVFLHGDATAGNSMLTAWGIKFFDFAIRHCCGDPMQDWSKAFFSLVLGFDEGPITDELFQPIMAEAPEAFKFHLIANMIRVQRRQPLNDRLMTHAKLYL